MGECEHIHQKEIPIYGSPESVAYHLWFCEDCGWFRVFHNSQWVFEFPATPLLNVGVTSERVGIGSVVAPAVLLQMKGEGNLFEIVNSANKIAFRLTIGL